MNSREDVGNCGLFFGNWGKRKEKAVDEDLSLQLKHCPAQIIGLCECQVELEAHLADDPIEPGTGAAHPAVAEMEKRPGFSWHTLRGQEDISCCIAARRNNCTHIEKLAWHRMLEGRYSVKPKKGSRPKVANAYTRLLMAEVGMKHNVGLIGTAIRVGVCHFHHQVANNNKGFRENQKKVLAVSGTRSPREKDRLSHGRLQHEPVQGRPRTPQSRS